MNRPQRIYQQSESIEHNDPVVWLKSAIKSCNSLTLFIEAHGHTSLFLSSCSFSLLLFFLLYSSLLSSNFLPLFILPYFSSSFPLLQPLINHSLFQLLPFNINSLLLPPPLFIFLLHLSFLYFLLFSSTFSSLPCIYNFLSSPLLTALLISVS